ncbi:MAG: glucose 1-dehydrogenase [Spirochaetaceae bacterium]|nr:glucose 1-dehydrogenase [Myxococcales bacterium]MCB9723321.1 glucose 1-dehydrogenase [Spirochaetaceae bacterium]HPG24625.1 glucose 1-dehydrogenase [Myxococcota bacterium]
MGRLQGRVAIVTGAGRGIGRGVALALAEEGASLGLIEIDGATLAETVRLVESRGSRVLALEGDVARRADCEAIVAKTVEAFGGLDVLVNNAAWTPTPGRLLVDFDDETFARVLATNLWATFWCMQAAHPHFVKRGRGAIVNFASGSGTIGNETQGAYAAAKEGIRGLSRVASREWGPQNIRVNIVCPFANSPGMIDWAALDPEGHAAAIEEIPLRRVGDCHDDVGRVVAFLASDDAAYVTGQTMWVDGGSGSVR